MSLEKSMTTIFNTEFFISIPNKNYGNYKGQQGPGGLVKFDTRLFITV